MISWVGVGSKKPAMNSWPICCSSVMPAVALAMPACLLLFDSGACRAIICLEKGDSGARTAECGLIDGDNRARGPAVADAAQHLHPKNSLVHQESTPQGQRHTVIWKVQRSAHREGSQRQFLRGVLDNLARCFVASMGSNKDEG